jgi:hypothetical protein
MKDEVQQEQTQNNNHDFEPYQKVSLYQLRAKSPPMMKPSSRIPEISPQAVHT